MKTTPGLDLAPWEATNLAPRDVAALLELARGGRLADIAERCHEQLCQWFEARAVGLYLFGMHRRPSACRSYGVPAGFLNEYEAQVRSRDPVLRVVMHSRHAMGCDALPGAVWADSAASLHLRRWGFSHNLQGPLEVQGSIVGTLNVARPVASAPFEAHDIAQFAWACQAVSVALHSRLDGPPACTRLHPDPCDALPPRAAAVARLLRQGASNKAIARDLGLSVHTVKEHVQTLCKRFGVGNRTALGARLTAQSTPASGGVEPTRAVAYSAP